MRADVVGIGEITPADVDAWRELSTRSLEPNPCFEPDFVVAAARTIDAESVSVLRVRAGTDWVACMPVSRVKAWRRIPIPALIGWRHSYSLLGTPLVDAATAPVAAAALIDGAIGDRATAYVALDLVSSRGPTTTLLEELVRERRRKQLRALPFERAVLHRRPENDYLAVGTKHRREWQRQRRRLQDELGEEIVTRDRSDDRSAVDDFLSLEAGGWKGRAGTAFSCLPGHAQLFRDICSAFEALGRLQLLTLEAGPRRLAVKCNLLAGDEIFCFKIAFDDGLAKYSPGIQLEIENVRVFHDDTKARLIDSCAWPDNTMINRLWPDRRRLDSLLVQSSPIRGSIGLGAAKVGSMLRSQRRAKT